MLVRIQTSLSNIYQILFKEEEKAWKKEENLFLIGQGKES